VGIPTPTHLARRRDSVVEQMHAEGAEHTARRRIIALVLHSPAHVALVPVAVGVGGRVLQGAPASQRHARSRAVEFGPSRGFRALQGLLGAVGKALEHKYVQLVGEGPVVAGHERQPRRRRVHRARVDQLFGLFGLFGCLFQQKTPRATGRTVREKNEWITAGVKRLSTATRCTMIARNTLRSRPRSLSALASSSVTIVATASGELGAPHAVDPT
jgi:hypothetical protein